MSRTNTQLLIVFKDVMYFLPALHVHHLLHQWLLMVYQMMCSEGSSKLG